MRMSAFSSPFNRRPSGRRGVVTLELILWLPIMIIFLLAVVEFALIMQFNQQVSYASRFGAKLAAEVSRLDADTPNLSDYVTGGDLQNEIDVYLANHGISASCEVKLEHNACVPITSQTDVAVPCNKCGASSTMLPDGAPSDEAYVKVTVCVKLAGNVPNVLSTFGFDLTAADPDDDPTIEHSTVFRIETANTSPTAEIETQLPEPPGVTVTPGFPDTADLLIEFPNNAATGATVQVTFNAALSSDPEEGDPFTPTAYAWDSDASPASGTGSTFTVTFTVPGDPGDLETTQPRQVGLRVRDSCNVQSNRDPLNVQVRRLGP